MWMEYVLVGLGLILILLFVSGMFVVKEKTSSNLEVYECGIEPMMRDKAPLYLHFFLIGVVFLLFDVELIVCIPMVWMCIYEKMWSLVWFVFFFILFVGLALEVIMETLSWKE